MTKAKATATSKEPAKPVTRITPKPKGPANIHEAINAVMAEVGYVQKESAPQLRYTFASERALIAALRPAMIDNAIIAYVCSIESVSRNVFETKGGTPMNETVTHGIVRFAHAPSGTYIDAHATGEGMDAGDKSANKAATGLLKYALRQTFLIETGDDPDYTPSETQERGRPEAPEHKAAAVAAARQPRIDNQWEKWVVNAIVDQGFSDKREQVVGRLNHSAILREVPYGDLRSEVGVAWMIAYQREREKDKKAGAAEIAKQADQQLQANLDGLIAQARDLMGFDEEPSPGDAPY